MTERSIGNAIIFVGNTGVGKSYICNRIFELCGSSTRFRATDSNFSVTQTLQNGSITFDGRSFTVIDAPGFFDTSAEIGESVNDGRNMCTLVKALENCEEIFALVFVYIGRFSTPHRMWFDRMKNLLTEAGDHIVLLHNKLGPFDEESRAMNANQLIREGSRPEYVWFSFNAENNQVQFLLTTIGRFTPFQLSNLVVPEICYERDEEEAPYEDVIDETTKDEGHYIDQIKDTSHYETREEWNNDTLPGKLKWSDWPGAKKSVQHWVTSQAVEKIWVQRIVTRRSIGTFVKVYKLRFDGSRDFKEKKQTDTHRHEVLGLF